MAWRVVVAGGGFGGLYAARRLERLLPRQSAQVTLVADTNFLLYTPLLPGAAAGTLEPRHVVVPLREELECTDVRLGQVTGADPRARRLMYTTPDGRDEFVEYDQLVVALGSVSRVLPVPGLAEHGVGFKNLAEAIALRNRALTNLEIAESLESPEEREPWLTFVFIGAGYAGLEGIAELQDYVADVIERYPRCRLDGTRWILVEAGERIMPEIHPGLAEFAARELRGRGIDIRTRTTLEAVTDSTATLSGGAEIPCRTLVWTAGVRPSPVIANLGLPVDQHGRIPTDEYLRVPGFDGVWAIGDAAAVPDPAAKGQRPTPPTAQHALRQGRLVGTNVAAALGHGHLKKFTYKTLGVFVDMGRHQAVAEVLRLRIRGFPAWFAARTYHLASMPGINRRLRLTIDWTVGLFFGRSAAELGQLGHPPTLADEAAPGELTRAG
jgi:NADH:ubiquinone reductase (H+-translocating)